MGVAQNIKVRSNAHPNGLQNDSQEWNLAVHHRRVCVSPSIQDCPVSFRSCHSEQQIFPASRPPMPQRVMQ